jgi:hypothetical protein
MLSNLFALFVVALAIQTIESVCVTTTLTTTTTTEATTTTTTQPPVIMMPRDLKTWLKTDNLFL